MEAEGAAGWDRSAAAWVNQVDKGDPNRELLLDPVVLECCGDVRGLSVLDVGCGEGRFARKLSQRGALVTGLDPCQPLISVARDRGGAQYLVGSAEEIPFSTGVFDLLACYLVLIDIPDFRLAIREMARVLKPGGRLVVANIIPFRSALPKPWFRDAEGELDHVGVDGYFEERPDHAAWAGISVTNFHRPLEAYFQAFLTSGLNLRDYRETQPTEETIARDPSFAATRRVPFFDVSVWER